MSKLTRHNILFDAQGLPHSIKFDDHYFCQDNGLEESRYVFCEGNSLTQKFKDLPDQTLNTFTIVETGFGTGLNFLCAWELWRQHASQNWKLSYVSIDKYPLGYEDIKKSLSVWPTLATYSESFLEAYSSFSDVINYCSLNDNIELHLYFDDVLIALDQIKEASVKADAIFLDGFAPSKNPEMWSHDVFKGLASISSVNTTFSTFTSAGDVLRGLNDVGFKVQKTKGYGRKRHMLKGSYQENEA